MLSLVIPVYRNEESISALIAAVAGLDARLCGELEAVFVVDGSPDRCYEKLHALLPTQPFRSKLILLSRNFGSFAAIRTGLSIGKGEFFAIMAADLQEPPDLVLRMAQLLREGDCDVVVGVRESRKDPIATRLAAEVFWGLYRRYVVPEMPPGGVDVFGCNRKFRDALLSLEERHSSLVAQMFWLGFRRKSVSYSRQQRQYGKSAWTLRKKLTYLGDSVFSFTDLPIRLLIRIGGGTALLAGLFGVVVALAKLLGYIDVPGYTMTIFVIVFLGAINLFGLGIVGSYAWRAYENTKQRPLAIPMRVDTFSASS
ncbi:glycosyl transferase [Betaproteobacteria bacterium UKL13-2]|nr:glycosyl transferase [Betaproteobacteria bacterium UKL13-2]HCG52912.1 glycosyltransferase [Betaproteobacteria bacterium]